MEVKEIRRRTCLKHSTLPVERYLDGFEAFTLVSQRLKGGMSYTDFLLCVCLYKYRNSKTFLISGDLNDIPSFFTREHVITIDTGNDIRNYGIYKFSDERFNKAAENILK